MKPKVFTVLTTFSDHLNLFIISVVFIFLNVSSGTTAD